MYMKKKIEKKKFEKKKGKRKYLQSGEVFFVPRHI